MFFNYFVHKNELVITNCSKVGSNPGVIANTSKTTELVCIKMMMVNAVERYDLCVLNNLLKNSAQKGDPLPLCAKEND